MDKEDDHFKVVDIPRNLHTSDGLHYVPHLANDPERTAQREQNKPGYLLKIQQADGLALGARMLAASLEQETTNHLATKLSAATMNSAWYERYGDGVGIVPDTSVMRSPIGLPQILIDPHMRFDEHHLRWLIASQLSDLSESVIVQAGIIQTLGVRSEKLARQHHYRLGGIAVLLSALRDYDQIDRLKTKKGRADRIREAMMATSRNAQLMSVQTGQHPSLAAIAEPLSFTAVDLQRTAPSQDTEATIKIAYEMPRLEDTMRSVA